MIGGDAGVFAAMIEALFAMAKLSVELMLRYSFQMDHAADAVKAAVEDVLDEGWRTPDLADETTPGDRKLGTRDMGTKVIEAFKREIA